MIRTPCIAARCAPLCFVALFLSLGTAQARTRHALPPVVVELFTAQGCAACPPADELITDLVGEKGVIPLTLPVDIWDYVGWSDTLAQPAFTARQRAYAGRMRVKELYTPEVVVDGRTEAPAMQRDRVDDLVAEAQDDHRARPSIHLTRHGLRLHVGGGQAPRGGAEVWLLRYDPASRTVKVTAGENRGKTVVQTNVVRSIVRLGLWRGSAKTYVVPTARADGLKGVILVQGLKGGPILAAQKS